MSPMPPQRRFPQKLALFALLALSALVFSGCNPNSPMYILNYDNRLAVLISNLFWPIIWVATAVFILVEGALLFALIKFRERPGQPLPAQTHGNTALEITWTAIPVVILAFITVPTIYAIFEAADVPPPGPNVVQINVTGYQWWWEFEYPELGIKTANEFHLPQGKTAAFKIMSKDVIHSFWVPRLGGKRDAIPGHVNEIWYHADTPGFYYGQCTEYCGDSHANMRIRAVVQTQEEFDAWVKNQQTNPGPREGNAAVGATVFRSKCISCHTINGDPIARGTIGPNLTHFGSRTSIGSGMYENTAENLHKWLKDPQAAKPGNKMVIPAPPLTEPEIDALIAYLHSLK